MADESGDGVHEIELGEDFEFCAGHLDEDRRTIVAKDVRDAFDRSICGNLGQRRAHDFADDELAKVFALQREIQDLVLEHRADGFAFFEYGKLRNILLLHGLQSVEDSLVRTGYDHVAGLAVLALDADDVGGRERDFGVNVAVLAHPAVVENFGHVTRAGIGGESNDEIAFLCGLGYFQRG